MPEDLVECRNCGSRELVPLGQNLLKCSYCGGVYHKIPVSMESAQDLPTCPICGKKPLSSHRCPWCLRLGICEEHFREGICSDCYYDYKQTAARSEREALEKQEADAELANLVAGATEYEIPKRQTQNGPRPTLAEKTNSGTENISRVVLGVVIAVIVVLLIAMSLC